MLVHIIADYGPGDLAFAEVVQRIKYYLPDAEPMLTPVPAFSDSGRRLLRRAARSERSARRNNYLSQRRAARR